MYDLHTLGWSSFQQLCHSLARESLGQTVQSFQDSGDGGRDGAFQGTWKADGRDDLSGSFVLQCKFTSRSGHLLKVSDLTDEVEKVKKLVANGVCDSYVLMTNAGLSGTKEVEIKKLFLNAGVARVLVLGNTWITQQIRENKRLRMMVPRVYGLGDLSQILDERAYSQARAILESMREDLAKVVRTDAYKKAADALDKHGFVLLIGEPAAGKTTIASMLAVAALDQWKAPLLKLDDPSKVVDRWNPDEPSQFFWIDDAFGTTQYEDFLARGWNRVLPQIKPMLRKGAKIVMTSRDYIYNRARPDLKESDFPLLKESQVVIDVHALSAHERRQILYNHLKLGKQPRSFRTEIKPFLDSVADHPRFVPETARRLADPLFTSNLFIEPHYIDHFVEKREQLLQEVLRGLDGSSKAALGLIYMRNDGLASPIELQPSEADALLRLGSDLGRCVAALDALSGSLVLHTHASGDAVWRFKHPTVGDAYAEILVENPEHLGIYVSGSAPERLVNRITCGEVGIEKAVAVPRALFPMVLDKLERIGADRPHKAEWRLAFAAQRKLQDFLARRCSKEFLALYLEKHPEILGQVSTPGLMLSAASEVRLASRLHEFGLLPEDHRAKFVETVGDYAAEGLDTDALASKTIRALFTAAEYGALVQRVRAELLPRLDCVRCEHQSNRPSDSPADEHMYELTSSFENLRQCFAADAEALKIIDRETERANEWIADNSTPEMERTPRLLGPVNAFGSSGSSRSVFDDIDADDGPEPT
ncbi:MAG: restriction endonuclease [Rhodanobacteraceae bacterium]|nr:restriction endonuclease [Rhodanobacteraceae bacterium]